MPSKPWTVQITATMKLYPIVPDNAFPVATTVPDLDVQVLTPVRDQIYQEGAWPGRLVVTVAALLAAGVNPQDLIPYTEITGTVTVFRFIDGSTGDPSPWYVVDDVSTHTYQDPTTGVNLIDVYFILFTTFNPLA
jgi:hypothetical protein